MQVLLNTDHHVDGRHQMAEHVETVVKHGLARFGEQVTRVEVHLADVNSHAKASPDDIQCTMEARLVGMDPIAVKEHAGTAHLAIQGAAGKLKRAIGTIVDKHHDPRHNVGLADASPT